MPIAGVDFPLAREGLGNRQILLGQFDDGTGAYVDGWYDTGCLVGYDPTHGWTKARCDAAAPISAQLVLGEPGYTGELHTAYRYVVIANDSMALTPGVPLYLDHLAAGGGKWSVTAPLGVGDLAQVVGFATAPGEIICEPSARGEPGAAYPYVKEGWVTWDAPTLDLGELPLNACVLSFGYWVEEPFNSDGTDTVRIGHDSDHDAFQTEFAVSVVNSIGLVSATGAEAGVIQSAAVEAKAYYVAGGSAPTTGKVHVLIQYIIATSDTFIAPGAVGTPGDIAGDLKHTGGHVGFFSVAPVVQPAAYTPTNVTPDRAFDADSTSLDEVADVLGTLIADLKAYGLLK
jgi:hypothetical protein